MLITFGIGFSIGSFQDEEKLKPFVEVYSDLTFGTVPLNVSFSSKLFNSNGKIENCVWNFNDGEISHKKNVTHVFYRNGIFNVTLTVWNEQGDKLSDSIEINVIEYYQPIATATSNITYGKAPLKIQFNAEGYDVDGDEFLYRWDFDDKTTSEKRNPIHTFKKVGEYIVRLTVFDIDGQQDTDIIHITVIDNYPPIAFATANKIEGGPPLTVEFYGNHSDVDGDAVTYHWYFENALLKNNQESTEQNPTHTFYFPGVYLVRLTIEDEDGESDTDVVKIEVKENWFSKITDRLFDFSLTRIIKQSLPDFIGNFILRFIGNIFGEISSNLLRNMI